MSTPYFRFKQFTIYHDRCAMKVGTDGVLLGCWAKPPVSIQHSGFRILDVGTGSGLIARMLASQRKHASRFYLFITIARMESRLRVRPHCK